MSLILRLSSNREKVCLLDNPSLSSGACLDMCEVYVSCDIFNCSMPVHADQVS